MKRSVSLCVLALAILVGAPCSVFAGGMKFVDITTISTPFGANLLDIPASTEFPQGKNYDDIIVSQGISFGKHFVGQEVIYRFSDIGFPVLASLTGSPTGPLRLQTGDPGENLVVYEFDGEHLLGGISRRLEQPGAMLPMGYGPIAVMFPTDQSQLTLSVAGGGAGTLIDLTFFRRDGSLIDTLRLGTHNELPPPNPGIFTTVAFAREGGVSDIAGYSAHPELGFDHSIPLFHGEFGYNNPIPEPSTFVLAALGILGLLSFARRRCR